MFFVTMLMMKTPPKESQSVTPTPRIQPEVDHGHINTVFSEDL